jgi:hypothetical protein
MIRPENMTRRQRWLEPQANLMNLGVSFPSSSVQEFYHYGGTGGFGTPFVAPSWGYASNFPSYGSHTSSSSHVETVVKKETQVVKKEVKKTEAEIYDETAFTKDYGSNVKDKAKIYDETAFSRKLSRSKQSRLSKKDIEFVDNVDKDFTNNTNNEKLKKIKKLGDNAEKNGDYEEEARWHRRVQEMISKNYGIIYRFTDPETKKVYGYNSLIKHYPEFVDIIKEMGKTIDDVFYYDKSSKTYFLKDNYIKYFEDIKEIDTESELKFSNYSKKISR